MTTTVVINQEQMCQLVKKGLAESGNGSSLRLEPLTKAMVYSVASLEENDCFEIVIEDPDVELF